MHSSFKTSKQTNPFLILSSTMSFQLPLLSITHFLKEWSSSTVNTLSLGPSLIQLSIDLTVFPYTASEEWLVHSNLPPSTTWNPQPYLTPLTSPSFLKLGGFLTFLTVFFLYRFSSEVYFSVSFSVIFSQFTIFKYILMTSHPYHYICPL